MRKKKSTSGQDVQTARRDDKAILYPGANGGAMF